MATFNEASPICRGKNLSWETVLLFFNNMPREAMPKTQFNSFVESRINSWTQTHSQIARQLAFYYEKDGICYPRFTKETTYLDLFAYMQNWATKYFIPNPYAPSLKEYTPTCIYSFIVKSIENGISDFHEILDSIFQVKLSSHDKVSVYLTNFTDLLIENNHVSLNEKLAHFESDLHPTEEYAINPKRYYEYFSLPSEVKSDKQRKAIKQKKLQQIYYGAPGTGKSFAIETATEGEDVIRTTFHPDSDYSTFVGAYKPTTKEVPVISNFGGKAIKVKDEDGNDIKEERIVYEFVNQAFLQAYVGAWKKLADNTIEPKKQYLVIEEINRGNCAQIFGDLFQLLDRNPQGFSEYPIKADADMKKQLKKQLAGLTIENADAINALYKNEDVVGKVLDGDILLLPSNLFIWATMNTSDQSLFPIDSAFKRRWDWKYVPIANAGLNWAIEVKGKKYDWWDFLKKINALIGETTNSEDKKLGYFFCKTETGIIDAESFVGKVIFYLWNDVFKDFEFEGDVFVDTDGETKLTFDKFYNSNATVRESTVEVFLNNLGVIYADEVANEELTPEEDDEFIPEETEDNASFTNVNGPDTSTYSINGQGSYGKTNVPIECVRLYASMHPESTIQEIVDVWQNLGVKHVKHLVETEEAHTQRGLETKDDKFKYKAKELILPQGGKVFVSNQFNVERIASFIEKVNAQDWGIYIAKIGGQKETLTNQNNSLKSNSQRFYVTFPDGTTIEERTQFETYTKALQKIGLDKAEPVAAQKRYSRLNCALIDRVQREEIVNSKGFSYVTIGGYHIVKNILVNTMSDVINNISQVLNLGVQAVITRV